MKSEEARQLLENPILREILDSLRENYINQIVRDPIECVEANIGLKNLSDLETAIESMVMDGRVEQFYEDQAKKYS